MKLVALAWFGDYPKNERNVPKSAIVIDRIILLRTMKTLSI
jgi:hypothetical protein